MAVVNGQQIYECQKCGQKFDNRSDLASHSYHKHVKENPKPKPKHFIPRDAVPEFKYLGKKGYARLMIEGRLTEKGMEIETIKYL